MKKTVAVICFMFILSSCSYSESKSADNNIDKQSVSSSEVSKTANKNQGKTFYQWFSDKAFAEAVAREFNKKAEDTVSEQELGSFKGGITAVFGENDSVKSLEGISVLKSLEAFACYKNDVEIIPDEILKLKNLKVLDLGKAFNLKSIPRNIGSLENLEYLRLNFTLVERLPDSITKLKKLKYLNLGGEQIAELPEKIGELDDLEFLCINSTQITKLPESISSLKKLKYLDCRDSFVGNLPKNIGNMKSLEVVDMFNCRLTAVPKSVKKLKNIKYFNVFDNRINDESYKELISKYALSCKYDYSNYDDFWEIYNKYFD